MLLVYNSTRNEAVIINEGFIRVDSSAAVKVPADFSGEEVHTWMAFVSEDG